MNVDVVRDSDLERQGLIRGPFTPQEFHREYGRFSGGRGRLVTTGERASAIGVLLATWVAWVQEQLRALLHRPIPPCLHEASRLRHLMVHVGGLRPFNRLSSRRLTLHEARFLLRHVQGFRLRLAEEIVGTHRLGRVNNLGV